jgi:polo-like kinase 1
MNNGTELAKI